MTCRTVKIGLFLDYSRPGCPKRRPVAFPTPCPSRPRQCPKRSVAPTASGGMARPLALAALSLLSLSSPARAAWQLTAGNEVRAFSSSARHGFLTAQNNAAEALIQLDGNLVRKQRGATAPPLSEWLGPGHSSAFGPHARDLSRWDFPLTPPCWLTVHCTRGWWLVDGKGAGSRHAAI